MKQFKQTAPAYAALYELAQIVQEGTFDDIVASIAATSRNPLFNKGAGVWADAFNAIVWPLTTGEPVYKVFAHKGNRKLPFVAFSTLPAVTCPGAGDCLNWCYSFRAWRFPHAFMRQLQNAFLMRFHPEAIAAAIAAYAGRNITMRLYVDGDFASVDDVAFWMNILHANPNISGYGYSKSLNELLAFTGAWPENYIFNLSSGHNATPETVERIKLLPIYRGEFISLNVGSKPIHGSIENNKALRAAAAAAGLGKVFPCPGKCGTCTGAGHACGLPQMTGKTIVIAAH